MHDAGMEDDERTAVGVLSASAAATRRFDSLGGHLTVRNTAQGLWIAAAQMRPADEGRQVERTLSATNALDGRGWWVEREILVNESPIGEPDYVASRELPGVRFRRASGNVP